tara:strand:- start:2631 stop:3137 length:507 start_codon:yes stop_codon:yes gene_type:complete
MNILLLNEDILINIFNIYYKNIVCKKYINSVSLFFTCKEINKLCKIYIYNKYKCNILYIKEINFKVCSYHNNINLDCIKNIIQQIKNIENSNNSKLNKNNRFRNVYDLNEYKPYINISGIDPNILFNYIHYDDLQKNINIIEPILNRFYYKVVNFCCSGNGCKIKKIK